MKISSSGIFLSNLVHKKKPSYKKMVSKNRNFRFYGGERGI